MTGILFRLLANLGPAATWIAASILAIIATFTLYVGIAIAAILRTTDPQKMKIRYRVFRDLLDLFRRRSR